MPQLKVWQNRKRQNFTVFAWTTLNVESLFCPSNFTWCFHFCHFFYRHPLPDHYKMILEVIRNLTSAASYTACDPSNEGSPRCQDRYKKGNKYLNRYLDVKCPKTQVRLFAGLKLTIEPVWLIINIFQSKTLVAKNDPVKNLFLHDFLNNIHNLLWKACNKWFT